MWVKQIRLSIIILGMAVLYGCSKEDCREEKKDDCLVTFELNPVCGCNGVTYDNPSFALCSGIDDYTMGACN